MHTTDSAPAANAAANASWKAIWLAAAVVGKGASGAVIRAQKASALSSAPALNVSAPNDTRRGTTVIPSSAARLGGRSLAESVTMATRLMGSPSGGVNGRLANQVLDPAQAGERGKGDQQQDQRSQEQAVDAGHPGRLPAQQVAADLADGEEDR